jgi:multiple sugar transport system ATP-binding protein
MLGIEYLLSRKPQALSGGQHLRVAVARVIVRNLKVFLLDEPLSNLDVGLRVVTRSELKPYIISWKLYLSMSLTTRQKL